MKRLLNLGAAALLLVATTLQASEPAGSPQPSPNLWLPQNIDWIAATDSELNAMPASGPSVAMRDNPPQEEVFEEPWFNGNKAHKYLGIGSIALATLALLSPKEEDGPHEAFAKGAAALGGAAVASGLVVHWDDIANGGGLSDPDNQHALLSALGALGFALAVSEAPEAEHAGPGAVGFVAMAIGIRLTW